MRLRIGIITPGTFTLPSPSSSSVEQVVHETTQRLKHDIDFQIYSKKTKRMPTRNQDANIAYFRYPFRSSSSYLQKVRQPLRRFRPHIVQIENRPKYVPYFKKRFPHSSIWLSLHSTRYISSPHISPRMLRRCLKAADKLVVNSHFLASYIQTRYVGTSTKIMVNHLGINEEQFKPHWTEEGGRHRQDMRQKWGYHDKKIILYVGRLLPAKGVHLLLKALPAIVEEHPETVLLIAGSAYYGSNRVTDYVRELHKLGNRYPAHVRFIPFVPHDEIHQWYQMADIAAVPSQGEEAFGLTNVEAMACGLPVIASKSGGIIEVLEDGVSGLLVDNGDDGVFQLAEHMNRLLRRQELRQSLGEGARERVEQQFTWSHTAARWLEAYNGASFEYF